MSNFLTPAAARETMPCPLARTFVEKKGANCMADQCPLWWWKPKMADDPEFKTAIMREMHVLAQEKSGETGKDYHHMTFHKQAVARVMRNPEGYGVKREEGYCGLGGGVT